MSQQEKEGVEFDKSLLFGEVENPFGDIEAPQKQKNNENTFLAHEEEHIQKPFKGELTLDEPLKETIVKFESLNTNIEKRCHDNLWKTEVYFNIEGKRK